jgi:hypothetical protein
LKILFVLTVLSACCFIAAYAARAVCDFTAVWANTVAVVDKVFAVNATRLIFFTQFSSPLSTITL